MVPGGGRGGEAGDAGTIRCRQGRHMRHAPDGAEAEERDQTISNGFHAPCPLSMRPCLQAAQAGNKAQRLSEVPVAFVADKAEVGDAGPFDIGQHFIDGQVAGVRVRLELQFRFDRQA